MKAIFAFSLVLLLAAAHAVTVDDLLAGIKGKTAPAFAASLVGSNVFQAYVVSGNTYAAYWAITENGKVTSAGRGRLSSPVPTVVITAEKAAVDRILSSQKAAEETRAAYNKGQIKVEWRGGNSFASRLSLGLMMLLPLPIPDGPVYKPDNGARTPPLTFSPPSPSPQQIGPYPGYKACEFYQVSQNPLSNKVLVTCSAYKAGDTFCALVMGSTQSKAVRCDGEMVICTVPCTYSAQLSRCSFDINRPRGANAAPLDFCPAASQPAPSSKKPTGALCQHGGECTSGNCVGDGMGPPWVYRCSCNPFKMQYYGC